MDITKVSQIIENGLAEKFWTDLNEESPYPVEFVEAAICFATLRELSFQQNTVSAAQA